MREIIELEDGRKTYELEEKPDYVYRWAGKGEPPEDLDLFDPMLKIEEELHDWSWSDGVLRYFGRFDTTSHIVATYGNFKDWTCWKTGECPDCGEDVPGSSNFCMFCGTEIEENGDG